jgi:hypothetical protein
MIGRSPGCRASRAGARALLATTALGAAVCSFGAAPALAATQQEGENLRREIESFLTDPGWPGYSFEHGPVTVEVVGDGYNLLIPDLVVVFDQPADQVIYGEPRHLRISLDDLNLRVEPDPVDLDSFGIQARLGGGSLFGTGAEPLRVVIESNNGVRAFVDVGRHELAGTWSSEVGYVTASSLSLQDIVATPDPAVPGAPDARFTIGAVRAVSAVTEGAPGLWDGTAEIVIDNVAVENEGEVPLRVDQVTVNQSFADFAFQQYMDWVRTSPAMLGEQPDFATEEEAQAFIHEQFANFPTLFDGFSFGWTVTGLDAGEANERVRIDSHEFGLAVSGLSGDLSEWTLRLFAEGMSIPAPEVPQQLVPTVFDLNLRFTDVPTGLGWQAMEAALLDGQVGNTGALGPVLEQQLVQLALQSQTGANLEGSIDWQTGRVEISGEVHADPTSPVMASGGLRIVVSEMQEFIREVESALGTDAAGGLTMVQALGQQEGNSTVYDFRISGSSVLMNGQDMQPLMMLLNQ